MNSNDATTENSLGSKRSKVIQKILGLIEDCVGHSRLFPWLVLLSGLLVWTAAQTYLVAVPVWTRDMLPELDDTLAYLVRTQEMKECFFQDCPALQDLRAQLERSSPDPAEIRQHEIGAFPFPIYHPLFSLILLGIERCGVDLVTAYKVLWSLAPLCFGLTIAYLLGALWGIPAAGVSLFLLAFKVFPDRGIHYVIPSGLAVCLAMLVWARIVSRRGDAPWTLIMGSILLAAMHPAGGLFAMMGIAMALSMPGALRKRKIWLSVLSIAFVGGMVVVLASFVKRPLLVNFSDFAGFPGFAEVVTRCLTNLVRAVVEIVRMKDGLFGSFALYGFAVALGFVFVSRGQLQVLLRVILICSVFIVGTLYHSHRSCYPGDVFLRMWIPLFIVVFGAVGKGICVMAGKSLSLLRDGLEDLPRLGLAAAQKFWPLLVLALTLGYSLDTIVAGSEQVQATAEFMRDRQPLRFSPEQTELLLTQSRPGDRVIYTSSVAMGFYFANGAMQRGAVYYHPVFEGTYMVKDWLERSDMAFVVAYNPTVYHPLYEGLDENNWRITAPDFHFSPLMKPIRYGTIDQGGFIAAAEFRWIDVSSRVGGPFKVFRVMVRNPGGSSSIEVVPVVRNGDLLHEFGVSKTIPPGWTGWVEFDVGQAAEARRFRITFPGGAAQFLIGGIAFDEDRNHWPWEERADVTFAAKDPVTGEVVRSFDPARNLPSPLNRMKLSVLDDRGSSVLFRIDR